MKVSERSDTPVWNDVTDQFLNREENIIQHLTDIWADRMGVPTLIMEEHLRKVTIEKWTQTQLFNLLNSMQPHEPEMFTNNKPRRKNKPPVIVKSAGVYFMIDGRRRSNLLYKKPGLYDVLIIE